MSSTCRLRSILCPWILLQSLKAVLKRFHHENQFNYLEKFSLSFATTVCGYHCSSSPSFYTVFRWISAHALISALPRLSAHPQGHNVKQAPPPRPLLPFLQGRDTPDTRKNLFLLPLYLLLFKLQLQQHQYRGIASFHFHLYLSQCACRLPLCALFVLLIFILNYHTLGKCRKLPGKQLYHSGSVLWRPVICNWKENLVSALIPISAPPFRRNFK